MAASTPTTSRRRALLLAVATLISAAAALAIGILLFGDFGGTEGRILATTSILALFGALAVPAAVLWDQRRLPALAAVCAALAAIAAAMAVIAIWAEPGDTYGKAYGTVLFLLLPTVVATALATRPLHRLFPVFVALSVVVSTMATTAMWTETESDAFLRVLGALVVLDVLLVVLQPLLQRAARHEGSQQLRLADTTGGTEEVEVSADSLAEAVAKAIRAAEREGRHVRSVEVLERIGSSANGSHPG